MDDFLFALFRLLFWPYRTWKETLENSRIGVSPDERETLKFWKKFGIIASILVVVGIVGVGGYFWAAFIGTA